MKKYDRKEIFIKAHSLRKVYNMNMSTALTKAWKMAKVAVLENEKFALDMKSLSGGRNNVVAQIEIRANEAAIERLASEISALQAQIYPTVQYEETYCTLSEQEKKRIENRIANADPNHPMHYYTVKKLQREIEESVRIIKGERLDLNAYNAA